MRKAEIKRKTNETEISIDLVIEGQSAVDIKTGFGFADHMLELMAHWANFDLCVECKGDMHVDAHHSLEDVGLCLGQAMRQSLGDRKGISRVGWARVPMDDALADVSLDISGRPYMVFNGMDILPAVIAGEEKDLWREFLKSFASSARINLHVNILYGLNGHHILESVFKSCGLALKQACGQSGSRILSTKGSLD
ncbi:MAG: imidazoleglycerol-phosphate dehydratase HisB [Thermodesulfobacteriota bacterium]